MVTYDTAGWRPTYDWEFPGGLWGWVVFLPDNSFYREVRLGGRTGSTVSPPWSPFQKLADHTYLTALFNVIVQVQGLIPPAPNTYAQFLNTIVGKPLALVNMGWSLELATSPLQNESMKNTLPLDRTLLPPSTPKFPTGQGPNNVVPPANTPQYSFALNLGDRDRIYNGMIGYWKTSDVCNNFDLKTPYTH